MRRNNLIFRQTKFTAAIFTISLSISCILLLLPVKVSTQQSDSSRSQSQSNESTNIKKLGERGMPEGRRRGGTSR